MYVSRCGVTCPLGVTSGVNFYGFQPVLTQNKTLHWTLNQGLTLKAYEGFFRHLALFIVVALILLYK